MPLNIVRFAAGTALAALSAILPALAPATAQVQTEVPGLSLPTEPAYVHERMPARDVPYPGTIRLKVDATDTARRIFKVEEVIPVAGPGPLVLRLPEWLPGKHAARGAINHVAGIRFSANGETLPWKRDPLDVYSFQVDVPAGVEEITARFDHLTPTEPDQGRIVVTPAMLNLQWEAVALYPAGHYVRQIRIQPSVTLPEGWTGVAALDGEQKRGSTITYDVTDFETLVDSPMFAGAHYREWDLGQNIDLNVFADEEGDLAATDEQIEAHRKLAEQAVKLYGARHYDRYEFLVALTDEMGGIGLEHHRSSENAFPRYLFTDWEKSRPNRGLLPHELNHSWNGKFRRGADLWTPDYRTPMQDSLLWVYEGQTSFWDNVLGVRSGLLPKDIVLGDLAETAAYYDSLPGRDWRPLVDTTNDPIINARRPQAFRTWQRSEDYYSEGALIWLEADMLIRTETGGRKSLADFARAFFGMRDGDWGTVTYTFEDVVNTLNAVHPYDWQEFLDSRVNGLTTNPSRGITMGGYELVWMDEPNVFAKANMVRRSNLDLSYSLGGTVDENGELTAIVWDGPLFAEGVVSGSRIVAVNGSAYEDDALKQAITAASGENGTPLELLIQDGDRYRTVTPDWTGGLRYPHLERTGSGDAPLDRLLEPLE